MLNTTQIHTVVRHAPVGHCWGCGGRQVSNGGCGIFPVRDVDICAPSLVYEEFAGS